MHHVKTTRNAVDHDGREHTCRDDQGTGSQQRSLDLQSDAGNRGALAIHRLPDTAATDGTSGAGVIRRAGDKLAFEAQGAADQGVGDEARTAIAAAIERHRKSKQDEKDWQEKVKELRISMADFGKRMQLDSLRRDWPEGGEVLQFLEGKAESDTIAKHKETLASYHDKVQGMSGWRWDLLKSEIWLALRPVCGTTPFEISDRQADDTATVKVGGSVVYTVFFDEKRFESQPDGGSGRVFTKKGHKTSGPMGGPDPRKQFVEDANRVKTRRFVTRAFNVYHLATMFGIAIKSPGWGEAVRPDPTRGFEGKQDALKQNLAKTTYEAKFKADGQTRFAGQEPRDVKGLFGDHAKEFNLGKAASYLPSGSRPNDFTDHYPDRRDSKTVANGRTGFTFTTGESSTMTPQTKMGVNEGSSMQVRNGSGGAQPYLSAASVQLNPEGSSRPKKIIRANKGERFDTGAENMGVVKIDLSLMPDHGEDKVTVVDQHSEPSHDRKIAWDRFYDKDDIKALAKRYDLLKRLDEVRKDKALTDDPVTKLSEEQYGQLRSQIEPSVDDMRVFTRPSDVEAIKSGDVTELYQEYEARKEEKYTKRSAPKELDEYIYSARKNREVLFDKLPLSAVSQVLLSKDEGKWDGLVERFPDVKGKLGTWVDLAEVQAAITSYLRDSTEGPEATAEEPYPELKAMHERAEYGKLDEGDTRT